MRSWPAKTSRFCGEAAIRIVCCLAASGWPTNVRGDAHAGRPNRNVPQHPQASEANRRRVSKSLNLRCPSLISRSQRAIANLPRPARGGQTVRSQSIAASSFDIRISLFPSILVIRLPAVASREGGWSPASPPLFVVNLPENKSAPPRRSALN